MQSELLVKRAKQGDKEALVEQIMLQKLDYYRLAYVYMKNKDDALDAIEDMIVILYENIHLKSARNPPLQELYSKWREESLFKII